VHVGLTDRSGSIPRGFERQHEAQNHALGVGVDGEQPPPPFSGSAKVSRAFSGFREPLERLGVLPLQSFARFDEPTLELGGTLQEKTIEEGTLVPIDCPLQVARCQRLLERGDIGPHHGRVQAKLITDGEKRLRADSLPHCVNGLIQEVPGVVAVAIRPQIPDQLFAG
jgi:hypothetical protein